MSGKILIEVGHQLHRRLVLKFPQRRNHALRPGLDEGISEVCNIDGSHWPDACIAGRECYQACFQSERSNLADFQQSIVLSASLRGKDQSGTVRVLDIGISMKREMEHT